MKFLDKYTKYKDDLICEGTVKSLIPIIQDNLLKSYNVDAYQDLTDEQKTEMQNIINNEIQYYEEQMNGVTDNKQYQSWLYSRLANIKLANIHENDWIYFKRILEKFAKIVKSPFVNKDQRNINNYSSIVELSKFVHDFEDAHVDYKKPEFKLLFSSEKYSIYEINREDKTMFQDMYGSEGFKCAWCVCNPEHQYFERYLEQGYSECYYLWTYKGTFKPFALLEFNSQQFKDIHNEQMMDYSDEVVDALNECASKFAEFDWSDCDNSDTDLASYKWISIYKRGKIGQLIGTDNDLKLYKDTNNYFTYSARDYETFILTNGDEDVVGAFCLDCNFAMGLMSNVETLSLIIGLRPQLVIDACRQRFVQFENNLINLKIEQHHLPKIAYFMTASDITRISAYDEYELYGVQHSDDPSAKYIIYNKKDKFYELLISQFKLFAKDKDVKAFNIDQVLKKHSAGRHVPQLTVWKFLEDIQKDNSSFRDITYVKPYENM